MNPLRCLSALLLPAATLFAGPSLEIVTVHEVGKSAEIVRAVAAHKRAVVTDSGSATIEVLDLSDSAKPVRIATLRLPARDDEELTSADLHPNARWVVATLEAKGQPGRVLILDARAGTVLKELAAGFGPDCVAISPDGHRALVANEGEEFRRDPSTGSLVGEPGSLTLVDLSGGPEAAKARTIPLPDLTGKPGFVRAEDKRWIERAVDWNGDGKIEKPFDFDGDGSISGKSRPIGTFDGADVLAKEEDGEEAVWIPITNGRPEMLEPEFVEWSPDSTRAFVTLQENNGVIVVDPAQAEVVAAWGLGYTEHAADRTEDGSIGFTESLRALREPDGIAVTPDGKYLLTADEGDTDPKASKTPRELPAGGGRTLTVLDAATGKVLGDTGNQIDEAAAQAGCYPDDRSDSKGSEPEGVVAFTMGGTTWAAVGLERAGAVCLVDLSDPADPRVVACAPLGKPGKAPEGIAVCDDGAGGIFLLAACEGSGNLVVLRVVSRSAAAALR